MPGPSSDDSISGGAIPQINLPKGGGAIRGIGETFSAGSVTGTASLSVPIATSPGRSGFGPSLSLTYDSGSGNGPFGLGWRLSLPAITRKTDKGLPIYADAAEADVFQLSGAEDLVPMLEETADGWIRPEMPVRDGYRITRYQPRIEGLFSRIERWTRESDGDTYWRTLSRDNVTSFYGRDAESRIADPEDPSRVFSWLICQSQDDRGNAILYSYASEDGANIDATLAQERNRTAPGRRAANRYPSRIRYGNTRSLLIEPDLTRQSWLFEVAFDYGEGHLDVLAPDDEGRVFASATLAPSGTWPARQDPFSQHRAGFEIRAYRLCRRVLMFHHFADALGAADYLVRSTELTYQENPVASLLTAVRQSGYVRQADGRYLRKSLPPLELDYTAATLDETVRDLPSGSLDNLPRGVDGDTYQWLDLDSEGLTGVLTEQGDSWYYKRNLGGRLGPLERVASRPATATLRGNQRQLLDLAGDGHLDLVEFTGAMAGYQERDGHGGWHRFRPFHSRAEIDARDLNLRFVDVTGDGFPDILISEDTVLTWYRSEAREGFAAAKRTPKGWDEESGPALLFADPAHAIFFADMTGDGLADIVRIRNGEVCYWPNQGYGRFGRKVTMDGSPVFDAPDLFEPRRIRLADIDGSGTADIVYVGRQGVSLYTNQSGNGWGPAARLTQFPPTDNLTALATVDLKGNGTACLVWSSALPGDANRPMRYVELMSGQKPYLLNHMTNNMGAETNVDYAPSTRFYLEDRLAGRPWITRLPFPVQLVARVEHRDLVSNTTLASTYRYRHGYFDGAEREYRGFAYVERADVETVIGEFDLAPVVTKSWFHNGAFLQERAIESHFKDPAHAEYFTGDALAAFLPDTDLPAGLTPEERREAARSLKGSLLRQEVYARDGTARETLPYSVSERSHKVICLQPRGPNRHAVFLAHAAEAIDYHYEREPTDPRIGHVLTLAVDGYGNVLNQVAIGYPRRVPLFDEQSHARAVLTEKRYTQAVLEDDAYRTPLPAEIATYELTAPALSGASPLAFGTVDAIANAAAEIASDVPPAVGGTQKRLVGRSRKIYRKDDLSGPLPLGAAEAMALPDESYRLALTPGLLDLFAANASRADLTTMLTSPDGAYRDLDGDGRLWTASGKVFYSPIVGDAATSELAFGRGHFFLPQRSQDPFGGTSTLDYDGHDLLVASTHDAVGNRTTAEHDYRVLQAQRVTDPNGSRAEARFDALGMLVASALLGKASGPVEGDSFAGFAADLAPAEIAAFFEAADPTALAQSHLGTATTRILYDLERVPVCAASIARQTHVSDLAPGEQSPVQLQFVYCDGFGRNAQTKIQAEPGSLDLGDPNAALANPRWVGTGETIYDNKGNPIRQYEPFFSATPGFSIEPWGVSSTLFRDPVGRVVATLHPDKTYEKTVFNAWQRSAFDVNDTVAMDPKMDPDIGEQFHRLADAEYLPTWYAQRKDGALGAEEQAAAAKAAMHADTPSIAHFDSLGRPFLTIADNGKDLNGHDQHFETRRVLDLKGNTLAVVDALGRTIMRYHYDLLDRRIHQASMEAGERWMLDDVAGKPIRGWNSRRYAFSIEYDALRRPVRSRVQGGDPGEAGARIFPQPVVFARSLYGDSAETGLTEAQQQQANLRTRVFRQFDGAGCVTSDLYDFKGNGLRNIRQLASDYRNVPDWSQNPALDDETFLSTVAFDALNRPLAVTTPDGSVYQPRYNEAGLLERVDLNLQGAATATPFVSQIDYNSKGQRILIAYGNGAQTRYGYDPRTFRLTNLTTERDRAAFPDDCPSPQPTGWPGCQIQSLAYTYDPAGNITHIRDDAQQTIYFRNRRVEPSADYSYDALYRLIEAAGREHLGQNASPAPQSYDDAPRVGLDWSANDGNAMGTYVERFAYDAVGNLLGISHSRSDAASPGWTRSYAYGEPSLIEPGKVSNRLSSTTVGSAAPITQAYAYDGHGNMRQMPQLQVMQWDFLDQLQMSQRQAVNADDADGLRHQGERTYYVYSAAGMRLRKVTERQAPAGQATTRRKERIYLGGFEIYREYGSDGTTITLERQTLHVVDGDQRIALVETRTKGDDGSLPQLIRYQLSNHLGSASLELDARAHILSYEEYYPYGGTSYQAVSSQTNTPKRYRYTGMERDEESGLSYHQARYYAPWLGRWTAADPAELLGGLNLFAYAHGNPVRLRDRAGTDPTPAVNLPQDEDGNYIVPGEVIEIHDKAPPLSVDESYRRRGLADIATLDEFERQRNFRDWYDRPGHQKDDFDRAREAMWITDPEGTSELYNNQLNQEFKEYRDAKAVEIRKGERIIDAAAGFSKGVAVVAIAGAAIFTGGFALGANSATTIGGTTVASSGSAGTISFTAARVATNPVVASATAGGGAVANEFAEEAPTLETALPVIETMVAEGEAFIGTNQQIAGFDVVGEAQVLGNTYRMTISGLYERINALTGARESGTLFQLFNGLRDRALAAGSTRMEIVGALVENPRLNQLMETIAGRYGFTFERISSSEFILRGPL